MFSSDDVDHDSFVHGLIMRMMGQRAPPSDADPEAVRSLMEMGFPEDRSRYVHRVDNFRVVLKHFKNNINTAMDYMINTPQEADSLLSSNRAQEISATFEPDQ
jgi:hypothetical protein